MGILHFNFFGIVSENSLSDDCSHYTLPWKEKSHKNKMPPSLATYRIARLKDLFFRFWKEKEHSLLCKPTLTLVTIWEKNRNKETPTFFAMARTPCDTSRGSVIVCRRVCNPHSFNENIPRPVSSLTVIFAGYVIFHGS